MELTSRRTPAPDLRKFLSTRRGAIIVAVVCAVGAAAVLLVAISRYRASVRTAQQSATVLVANRLIPKGTSGTAIATGGSFSTEKLAQKQVTAGAVTDMAAISGRIAARDILPGEQLTAAEFTSASGVAAELTPSQRAISLTLDQAHGLTGVVQAGDHVDVYAGFNVDRGSGPPSPVVRLLAANVKALQVRGGGSAIGGGGQSGTTVIAVDEMQSAMLAFAQQYGSVWLVLRGNGASATQPVFMNLGAELLGMTPIQNAAFNRRIVSPIAAKGSQ
jgi:Flp pilus assembly protein CpaB